MDKIEMQGNYGKIIWEFPEEFRGYLNMIQREDRELHDAMIERLAFSLAPYLHLLLGVADSPLFFAILPRIWKTLKSLSEWALNEIQRFEEQK